MRAASKGFLKALAESRSKWSKIKRPKCDLCSKAAIWEHPQGGLRCGLCSRPEGHTPTKPRCPEDPQYSGWCNACGTKHNEG